MPPTTNSPKINETLLVEAGFGAAEAATGGAAGAAELGGDGPVGVTVVGASEELEGVSGSNVMGGAGSGNCSGLSGGIVVIAGQY